ncbi:MAG: hypothetical protein LBF08_08590 [Dysgonamonadaceae bacterium]|jgi:hypothetical protein|nr:hypothetical protein [Dysgonamonadaceae bacterium]
MENKKIDLNEKIGDMCINIIQLIIGGIIITLILEQNKDNPLRMQFSAITTIVVLFIAAITFFKLKRKL